MIYPIKVLRKKCEDVDKEIVRIMDVPVEGKHDAHIKAALRKLNKRKKDLTDAIGILIRASTIDEEAKSQYEMIKSK